MIKSLLLAFVLIGSSLAWALDEAEIREMTPLEAYAQGVIVGAESCYEKEVTLINKTCECDYFSGNAWRLIQTSHYSDGSKTYNTLDTGNRASSFGIGACSTSRRECQ